MKFYVGNAWITKRKSWLECWHVSVRWCCYVIAFRFKEPRSSDQSSNNHLHHLTFTVKGFSFSPPSAFSTQPSILVACATRHATYFRARAFPITVLSVLFARAVFRNDHYSGDPGSTDEHPVCHYQGARHHPHTWQPRRWSCWLKVSSTFDWSPHSNLQTCIAAAFSCLEDPTFPIADASTFPASLTHSTGVWFRSIVHTLAPQFCIGLRPIPTVRCATNPIFKSKKES